MKKMYDKTLKNTEQWIDTDGNIIHAHGGHIVKYNDTYYWYGEDRRDNIYVSCYSSKDLMNWEFKNHILTTESLTKSIGLQGETTLLKDGHKINIERPKVIYNPKTKKYVMLAHYENGPDYSDAAIAISTCDSPDGNFVYHGYFRPFGYMSRDCNMFEDNGAYYFISASNDNKDLHVYCMDDDFMGVKSRVNMLFEGQSREAPAFFKDGQKIYILTSRCTGWRPNQGGYSFSESMEGSWSAITNFGDETTFQSQPTSVLRLDIGNKVQYVYIGDRWGGTHWDGKTLEEFEYQNSSYYFSLIEIRQDGSIELKKCEEFTINLENDGFIILK